MTPDNRRSAHNCQRPHRCPNWHHLALGPLDSLTTTPPRPNNNVSRHLDSPLNALYRATVSTQNALANPVRRHRPINDLTQAQLAQAVGVSRQTILAIDGGGYDPFVRIALKLAEQLGTTLETLFGEQARRRSTSP